MKKNILFIISGSIAASKILNLLNNLKNEKYSIEVIITKSGEKFIKPSHIENLINKKIYKNVFKWNLNNNSSMDHINLSRRSDLVLVCPASANLIAKIANGFSDDFASSTIAACNKKIFIVPAMNKVMWSNLANQENIKKIKKRNIEIIGPVEGSLACGEYGLGRMEDVNKVEKKIKSFFNTKKILCKKSFLITAGPTFEPIDPVRYIGNFSSGKQGFEIAKAAKTYGANTILITGPTIEEPPKVDTLIKVQTAKEMYKESIVVCKKFKNLDVAICSAAVADFTVTKSKKKYKKNENFIKKLKIKKNKDILMALSNLSNLRPKMVCGFSAETNNLISNSRKKLLEKNCDFIFANKISEKFNPMGDEKNKISIIGRNKIQHWKKMSKVEIGEKIIKEISTYIN